MGKDSGGGLHEFVTGRYPDMRRSAFLMCGDWSVADELTRWSLAHLVAEHRRGEIDDPDAYAYAQLMAAFQHRPARREHVFVAASDPEGAGPDTRGPHDGADQIRTVLLLDALHELTPRCRAVMVLRHFNGFAVDETADVLGLTDKRVEAYEAAGLAALERLLVDSGSGGGR